MGELLDEVLARVTSTRRPVVVFDLDSTLLSTSARHLAILRAFGQRQGGAVQAATSAAAMHDIHWSPEEVLAAAGLSDPELMPFWAERFFSDLCEVDVPNPGAVRFARAVHEAGAILVYLTGRVRGQMGRGTARTLLDWGFPCMDGQSMLYLKPFASLPDAEHKDIAMARIGELGTVVATFENEPAHANAFAARFPGGVHVLLDTCHGPGAPPVSAGVTVVPDFWA